MTNPVALSKEELGWFRGQGSGSFRRAETGARLLATIDARDQRIRTLEAAVKAWEAQNTWLTRRLGRALLGAP